MALVIQELIIGDQNVKKTPPPPVVYDRYANYDEAEIHRSGIMQDFRDSEKKNSRLAATLDFLV